MRAASIPVRSKLSSVTVASSTPDTMGTRERYTCRGVMETDAHTSVNNTLTNQRAPFEVVCLKLLVSDNQTFKCMDG